MFAGTELVGNQLYSFTFSDCKFIYWIGIRFTLIPDKKIVGRLNFGLSEENTQYYLSFNEAVRKAVPGTGLEPA